MILYILGLGFFVGLGLFMWWLCSLDNDYEYFDLIKMV